MEQNVSLFPASPRGIFRALSQKVECRIDFCGYQKEVRGNTEKQESDSAGEWINL